MIEWELVPRMWALFANKTRIHSKWNIEIVEMFLDKLKRDRTNTVASPPHCNEDIVVDNVNRPVDLKNWTKDNICDFLRRSQIF